MLEGQSARRLKESHLRDLPLVLCSAAQFLTTENLRKDDKNINHDFFFLLQLLGSIIVLGYDFFIWYICPKAQVSGLFL